MHWKTKKYYSRETSKLDDSKIKSSNERKELKERKYLKKRKELKERKEVRNSLIGSKQNIQRKDSQPH